MLVSSYIAFVNAWFFFSDDSIQTGELVSHSTSFGTVSIVVCILGLFVLTRMHFFHFQQTISFLNNNHHSNVIHSVIIIYEPPLKYSQGNCSG